MSLLVLGALHWDVVVRAPHLPREDETLRGSSVAYQFGGKGGNQAVAAARAGAQVYFAGRVGEDEPGRAMREVLVQAGVDVSGVQMGAGASGMSVAITAADGEYAAVIVSGENRNYVSDKLTFPEGCQSILMQNEMAPGLFRDVAQKTKQRGVEVIWNVAPAGDVDRADLGLADTLIVNRVEAADLLGVAPDSLSPQEILQQINRLAPSARIILTLGAGGVAFCEADGEAQQLAAETVDVVSTHGAGDVFVGTYVALMQNMNNVSQCIDFAQKVTAQHISQSR